MLALCLNTRCRGGCACPGHPQHTRNICATTTEMQFYSPRPPLSPMDPYSPPFSPTAYGSPTISYANQSTFYPQDPAPIPVDDVQYDPNIHPYWRDRVVPRPGFKSSRALGPTPESSRIVIKNPNKLNQSSKQQLLPPRSYAVSKKQSQDKNEIKAKSPDSSPTIVST